MYEPNWNWWIYLKFIEFFSIYVQSDASFLTIVIINDGSNLSEREDCSRKEVASKRTEVFFNFLTIFRVSGFSHVS